MQKDKCQVLIVDDDFRVALLIKKLIHWDELNLECTDVVDNGERALEIIESVNTPDIIITDIRMPKITGLDLISKARELEHHTAFIVISGYQEFEYAQRALQYGAEDYLVKPINEKELNETLTRIVQRLDIKKQSHIREKEMTQVVSESRHILKRDMLNNILEHNQTEDEDYGVSLQGALYRGIDVKLDYIRYNSRDKKQDRLVMKKIGDTIEEILEPEVHEVLICEKEYLHTYCLFNYNEEKTKVIKQCISNALSNIIEYISPFKQYEVTIGIGMEQTEFGKIRFSISEAHRAVCNRIKMGTSRLIYIENIGTEIQSPGEFITMEQKEEIKRAIVENTQNNLEHIINEIFSTYQMSEELDYSACYKIASDLIEFFFENTDIRMEESATIRKDILSECYHCYTIASLKDCLKANLGQVILESQEAIASESAKPIRQAKQYVESHCGDKIVLEDLAELVGLNPVYFSVLFKKETDMNFSTYLVMVRIEKAKTLLTTTNETIAAISDQVGYKDSRYFSRTFAKQVGVKPVVYRKLYS